MRIPRWTTYPAIAILLIVAFVALPRGASQKHRGAALETRQAHTTNEWGVPIRMDQARRGATLRLIDFLPEGHVIDGSVDYREVVQEALDASAGGTLELPDFPVRVGRAPGQVYCLVLRTETRVTGSPASVLVTRTPAAQVLRAEGVSHLVLEGFGVRGVGHGGMQLGHGLVQITGGDNVQITALTVDGADCDGIAIASVEDCTVEACVVEGASRAGIYLNGCSNGVVRGNIVRDFGGHIDANDNPVGAGIMLSSNDNVLCSDNVIRQGQGVGILSNSHEHGDRPSGNTLRGNRIESVSNPLNKGDSGGIRLTNGNQNRGTGTFVTGNSISNCGDHGIYAENHGGSAIIGNLVTGSEGTGILVSTIQDLQLLDNVVLNSDTVGTGSEVAIRLINGAEGVQTSGNVLKNAALLGYAGAVEGVEDLSTGGEHSLEPRVLHAASKPECGTWGQGDIIYNTAPTSGGHLGWVCTAAGTPGEWAPFGRIE